jgi:molybdopterin converting factor small subunit
VITLRIPGPLRPLAGDLDEVQLAATTVDEALGQLTANHPALRRHLYDEAGALRGFVNIYLNEEDVRSLAGLHTVLSDGDLLTIVPSVAGGSAS